MTIRVFSYILIGFINCSFISLSQNEIIGCSQNYVTASDQYEIFQYSGNPQLDTYLNRDVNVLRNFFQVNPSVYYFIDSPDAPNAMALSTVEDPNYSDGTIVLGQNLIISEFQLSQSGTTIPFILAHEFAHIVDFLSGSTSCCETKVSELFADFLSGSFLYYRSVLTYTDVQAAMYSFYSKGDFGFNDPDHHGTPQERLQAFISGYNWLRIESMKGKQIPVELAIEAALDYLEID